MWRATYGNTQKNVLLLVFFILIWPSEQKRFHSVMGPFKAVLRRLTPCPPEVLAKESVNYTLHDSRTNRLQMPIYSGKIWSPISISDNFDGRLTLASWSNMGGWKDNAHVFNFKALCKTLDLMSPEVYKTLKLVLFGENLDCPFYPGFYTFDNFTVDVTANQKKVPIKYFLYGRWRCDALVLYKTGDIAACMRAFVDTLPE